MSQTSISTRRFTTRRSSRGFTLVEMAVVLVIIGVILGAVMIGRDAQRNAEYLRIRQAYINQWALAYNSYVQRVGTPVGDRRTAPRLMVNGDNYTGALGGDLSGVAEPKAICEGSAGPNMNRSAETGVSLRKLMLDAGIELPQGRGIGMEDRFVYRDTNGNPQELQVCFQWDKPGTRAGSGNVMVITGLTPDLARSLDSAIDGIVDKDAGSFRSQEAAVGQAGTAAQHQDWDEQNTQKYTDASDVRTTDDREAQVKTVVAYYKMNQ